MPLHFELVTPAKLVRSEEVYMVVVPGAEGEAGILANHAPLMTTLKDHGVLKIYSTEGASPEEIHLSGGFAEVSATGLTVLAESVEG
jgi:F-type H+-transporting ATPase subunit epsilon